LGNPQQVFMLKASYIPNATALCPSSKNSGFRFLIKFHSTKNTRRQLFDEISIKNNFTPHDWYKVDFKNLDDVAAQVVIKEYKGSLYRALCNIYPETEWQPWKFVHNTVPHGFWTEQQNQRKFFDDLGKQVGVATLDDWYFKLSWKGILANGGRGLLRLFDGSPSAALMSAYPEYHWLPWNFNHVPKRFWNSKANVSQFIASLSEKLSIKTLDDWYRVDVVQLKLLGAASITEKYHGLYRILKEHYPHHPWDEKKFKQPGKKGQRWLLQTVKALFPGEEIVEDYQHPNATLPTSKRPLQLDVFIPSRSLAFEYQGMQHFQDVSLFAPTKTCQQRDEEKRLLCAINNIKLIEVPYWWNRTQDSLQQLMQK